MPRLAGLVIAALFVLGHATARADVVGPPPSDCAEGTVPVTGHCSVCAPDACATDADCESGERCEERSYCTRVYETCGGWGGPGATDARPMCGAGVSCPADAPCTAHRVCVAGAAATDGGSERVHARYDCGCRVGERGGARLGWLAVIAALAMVIARRRRG